MFDELRGECKLLSVRTRLFKIYFYAFVYQSLSLVLFVHCTLRFYDLNHSSSSFVLFRRTFAVVHSDKCHENSRSALEK